MVVNNLALNGWGYGLSSLGAMCGGGIPELCRFGVESCLDILRFCVFKFLGLYTCHLMAVLLWENFAILDGLNSGVEVLLVDLTLYGGLNFLMSSRLDLFMFDGRSLSLVNGGIVVAMTTDKFGDGCLRSFHDDSVCVYR